MKNRHLKYCIIQNDLSDIAIDLKLCLEPYTCNMVPATRRLGEIILKCGYYTGVGLCAIIRLVQCEAQTKLLYNYFPGT